MSQQWDFAQFAVNPSELQWPSTTSKVFAVRRFAFDDVGGFPEAFSQYGCEDNALAWKLLQARYNPTALPPRFAEHLRGRNEDDDGLFKMQRLSRSANLFYRLMISTDVHSIYWHFFSCLGERPGLFSTALRATLKRSYRFMPIRFAMKAFVFLLTLQQTDDRRQFLRGSLEAVLWSIRTLIAKIVRLAIAAYVAVVKRATSILQYSKSQLLRASYFIRGNLWRIPWTMAEPAHRIKANLWRIPWTLTEPGRIVKANLWFFKSPQGWIRKNWPWLYRTFVVRFEHKRETQK